MWSLKKIKQTNEYNKIEIDSQIIENEPVVSGVDRKDRRRGLRGTNYYV